MISISAKPSMPSFQPIGPNGSAWVVALGSRVAGRIQTGYVYTYAFVMLLGLTGVVTWAIYVSAK